MSAPIEYTWTGEVMEPLKRFHNIVNRDFVVGETYRLVQEEERSQATHNHEFAWLHDAWQNLPENVADLYPTPEHLRKRALIEAGYYNEEIIDTGSKAGALRVAASFRKREEFSLVIVRGAFVIIRSPKSQSRRAMKKAEFQASKSAIMEVIAAMIGVAPEALSQARAA